MPALPVGAAAGTLMIGHVVLGYLRFRFTMLGAHSTRDAFPFLTRSKHHECEQCYVAQWRGEIDTPALELALEDVVGDAAANVAFAGFSFWGAIIRCRPRRRFARALKLNQAQLARAYTLFRQRHTRIEHAVKRTEANLAAAMRTNSLDDLSQGCWPSAASRELPLLEVLTEQTRLSGDELASVRVQLAFLRRDVTLAHIAARERFLAALEPAQRNLLDVIEHARTP